MSVSQDGGVSVQRPADAPDRWRGSFSVLPLCVKSSDVPVELKDVRATKTSGEVGNMEVWVMTPRDDRGRGLMFASAVGAPPIFEEVYARSSREYARHLEIVEAEGRRVESTDCRGREVSQLVVSFSTNRSGGAIQEWEVLYAAGEELFTTGPIAWEFVLCGDASPADLC